ncbi:MAG: putative membrane protein [Candidatus Argoarchaeum ethanivorans]|uniref:Putative membrane protein n=1 Tax=Candidatus Argoarchaeum ethanivorans TaxID=2608793 RepID=A0A8B3S1U2_9EURY|nr:MAG: putative membrane protein [Candidatus Argoarchaeum ethanivorans]
MEVSIPLVILSIFFGYFLGIITGMVPGFHVNNIAVILLAITPLLSQYNVLPLYIVIVILSNSITHTFIDIIPAVLIGVPESDTALAVLPGHALTMEGRGIEAIRLSAIGSAGAILTSLLLALPMIWIFKNYYTVLQEYTAWLLITLILMMVLTEKGEQIQGGGSLVHLKYKSYAVIVFLLSGLLGLFAFEKEALMNSIIPTVGETVFLPLLSGLFGASVLLISMLSKTTLPEQQDTKYNLPAANLLRGIFFGSTAGSLVAWFPGVSSAVATIIARIALPRNNEHSHNEFIVSLSGANTSNALFSLIALYVIGKSRSGAVSAINQIIQLNLDLMVLLFVVIVVTALLSYPTTIFIGKQAVKLFKKINYTKLSTVILSGLLLIVVIFTGVFGLVIFAIAIPIGMLPHYLNVRKSHLMGCILLPVTLYFL